MPYYPVVSGYAKWTIYYSDSKGWINDSGVQTWSAYTRPVFYLRNNLLITKGDGTKDEPFIIQ